MYLRIDVSRAYQPVSPCFLRRTDFETNTSFLAHRLTHNKCFSGMSYLTNPASESSFAEQFGLSGKSLLQFWKGRTIP